MKGKTQKTTKGEIYRIAGPVAVATGIDAKMYDVVRVGKEKLMGEVPNEDEKESKRFSRN